MSPRATNPGSTSSSRRRALIGTAVLAVLVVLAGLTAYLTRDGRASSVSSNAPDSVASSASPSSTAPVGPASPPTPGSRSALPVPLSTHDPIAFGKAAAVALWPYDTRPHSQPKWLAALHTWLTSEPKYADPGSVDALVPSPVLWGRMADHGQYATATVNEAHFPDSFTRALQADPGAITTAYIYAVTVSGKQSIAWTGAPRGGAEARTVTLAVQCRPSRPCALAGVLPAVAP
ncbi:hypothetical protein [Streptomyces sp. NPDC059743]|uniref:hypothetical protein n=1 Tax=Streptomyces sp. NPDC059743 TaxID=3346928 RepID=UPI003647D6D9